ncbi:hypothetical protein TSUD_236690 [Trifolium subterraneum]|uniref:Uncharacterized protein n=1 Tax=Trifolium subterraneum TaxID=3900 RepID=A0A2Z6PNF5_TRISU|nr:hypothetical protein TSUD_236690 [Trifolium subterraneum]
MMEPSVPLHCPALFLNGIRIRNSNSALAVVVIVVLRFLECFGFSFEFDSPGSVTVGSVKPLNDDVGRKSYRERERERERDLTSVLVGAMTLSQFLNRRWRLVAIN